MEKIVPNRNFFRESWLSFLFGHYPERAMEALKKGSADPSRRLMIASIADDFLKTEPTNHLAMVADRQIQLFLLESIWNLERFLRHRSFGVKSLRVDLGLIDDGTYRNYYSGRCAGSARHCCSFITAGLPSGIWDFSRRNFWQSSLSLNPTH